MDKSNWSLIFERPNRRERREEEKREEEEEEEKKKRREEENGDKKGMDSMIFGMDIWNLYGIKCILDHGRDFYGFKSRVLLEFHPNLGFLEIGLVKPHMEQDEYGILPLRLDSWLNGK